MDRQLWRDAFEQVEHRIQLNLEKLIEHNETRRQAARDAEARRSSGGLAQH